MHYPSINWNGRCSNKYHSLSCKRLNKIQQVSDRSGQFIVKARLYPYIYWGSWGVDKRARAYSVVVVLNSVIHFLFPLVHRGNRMYAPSCCTLTKYSNLWIFLNNIPESFIWTIKTTCNLLRIVDTFILHWDLS